MEVKIGVQHAPRELTADTEKSADEVLALLNDALQQENGVFTLNDSKGRTVAVPAQKLAYLYFTAEGSRKVGFGPTS